MIINISRKETPPPSHQALFVPEQKPRQTRQRQKQMADISALLFLARASSTTSRARLLFQAARAGSRSSSSPTSCRNWVSVIIIATPWRTWVSDIVIANTVEDLGLRHGHPHKTFATGIPRGPSPRTSSPGGAGSGRDEEMKSMRDSIMITNLEDAGYPKDPSLPASLLPSLPPTPPSSPPSFPLPSPPLAPKTPSQHPPSLCCTPLPR
jgi:hypothetical protein